MTRTDDVGARALAELVSPAAATLRFAVVTAHPDDETLGAGAVLPRLSGALFVHVTDGAPRDGASHVTYAETRRSELLAVLTAAGVPASRSVSLDVPDQQAVHALAQIARALARTFARHEIEVVLTHAYEGGHPDHDATSFAVHAAADLLGPSRPALLELTSYHAGPHDPREPEVGRFLPHAAPTDERVLRLSAEDRTRKRALLDRYASQRGVVDWLLARSSLLAEERFRRAPRYDFLAPPHQGTLHHQTFPWGVDARTWRAHVVSAQAALGLAEGRGS